MLIAPGIVFRREGMRDTHCRLFPKQSDDYGAYAMYVYDFQGRLRPLSYEKASPDMDFWSFLCRV